MKRGKENLNKKLQSRRKLISQGIYARYIKRVFDCCVAFIAIILLSPVLLIISILVKIKLGSPVLFKQERAGFHEKPFFILKFRTMTNERNEKGELLPDEIRLTKFGKILRSTSLDELPSLINILRGEMSIIGPRALPVLISLIIQKTSIIDMTSDQDYRALHK